MSTRTLPAIGTHLPAQGGTLGAILARPDGSTYGLIVCDAEHAFRAPWGPSKTIKGATGIDGMAATRAMAKAGSKAAKRVLELRAGGHADWHIPTRLELLALYLHAPQTMEQTWHWSCTQASSGLAWIQLFNLGSQSSYYVSAEGAVRAVRSFELQSFNPLAEGGAA